MDYLPQKENLDRDPSHQREGSRNTKKKEEGRRWPLLPCSASVALYKFWINELQAPPSHPTILELLIPEI